jgi:hypothetical protein
MVDATITIIRFTKYFFIRCAGIVPDGSSPRPESMGKYIDSKNRYETPMRFEAALKPI